jgi:hypothetical protein
MKKIPVGTVSKSNWKIVGRGKINTTLVILNDKDVLEIKIINYIAQDLY